MSLWACPKCKNLVCPVNTADNITCPVCGSPCQVVTPVKDANFDQLDFIDRLNKHFSLMSLNDDCRLISNITEIISSFLVSTVVNNFVLDVNEVWHRQTGSTKYIITYTLRLKNKYYFTVIYSRDGVTAVPSHLVKTTP